MHIKIYDDNTFAMARYIIIKSVTELRKVDGVL